MFRRLSKQTHLFLPSFSSGHQWGSATTSARICCSNKWEALHQEKSCMKLACFMVRPGYYGLCAFNDTWTSSTVQYNASFHCLMTCNAVTNHSFEQIRAVRFARLYWLCCRFLWTMRAFNYHRSPFASHQHFFRLSNLFSSFISL